MTQPWVPIIVAGTIVGLVASFGPWIVEYARLMRLVVYINMDRIQFEQLWATGGAEALAEPLTRKLVEKGILLSWRAEREVTAMRTACAQAGTPLGGDFCEAVLSSLADYRLQAGLQSERIAVLGWHPDFSEFGPLPKSTWTRFDAITRDWQEFIRYAKFLHKFLTSNTGIETEKLGNDA